MQKSIFQAGMVAATLVFILTTAGCGGEEEEDVSLSAYDIFQSYQNFEGDWYGYGKRTLMDVLEYDTFLEVSFKKDSWTYKDNRNSAEREFSYTASGLSAILYSGTSKNGRCGTASISGNLLKIQFSDSYSSGSYSVNLGRR